MGQDGHSPWRREPVWMGLCRCDQLSEQVPGAVETRARGRVGLRKRTGDLHGHSRIEVHRLCAGGGGRGCREVWRE